MIFCAIIKKILENVQTVKNSRGWLGLRRFSDQLDRIDANYFLELNERNKGKVPEKFEKLSKESSNSHCRRH